MSRRTWKPDIEYSIRHRVSRALVGLSGEAVHFSKAAINMGVPSGGHGSDAAPRTWPCSLLSFNRTFGSVARTPSSRAPITKFSSGSCSRTVHCGSTRICGSAARLGVRRLQGHSEQRKSPASEPARRDGAPAISPGQAEFDVSSFSPLLPRDAGFAPPKYELLYLTGRRLRQLFDEADPLRCLEVGQTRA